MMLRRLFATALAILAASSLLADNCNPCECSPCECAHCESNDFCDFDPIELCNSFCHWCDFNEGWSAEVDWIYWKVRRSDLDYAIKGSGEPTFPTQLDGSIRSVKPSRDSGFRVAMYKDCGDCYRFGLRYTSFETESHAGIRINEASNNFVPTRLVDDKELNYQTLDEADSVYKFDLDIIDLESSCLYPIDCAGSYLRAISAVRYAYIDQKLRTFYSNSSLSVNVHDGLTIDGWGLLLGLEGEWKDFCRGWGFYGRANGILSFAECETNHFEYHSLSGLNVFVKKHQYLIVPSWDLAVGIQRSLCDFLCASWEMKIGYEFHCWCNFPEFMNFSTNDLNGTSVRAKSDLGYEGWFLRLNANF